MAVTISGSTGIAGVDGSASTPAVQGTDTNTGIYFPAADRIAFAEGGVQVGEFDSSANFMFNSGYGSVATAYGCRAWVNFNGTGTVAIRASGNVSSITDNGTGLYTVNFTNAMPDANYCVALGGDNIAGISNSILNTAGTYSTSSINLIITSGGGATLYDENFVNVAIFR